MLGRLHEQVNIDILLEGNLKSGLRKLRNSAEALLQEFNEYADGNIHYRLIDPVAGGDDTSRALVLDSLAKMGIQPMTQIAQSKKGEEQSQRIVIPAAIIKYKDRQLPVDLLKGVQRSREGQSPEQLYVNAENLLEYKFASTIDKLVADTLPAIGYLMGNGEPLDYRVYSLIQFLRENFRFGIVQLDSVPVIPGELNALIMVKPTEKFSDDEKRKLDQFVMRGGSLVCMIDNLNAEMDSLQTTRETVAFDKGLNLDDLLFRYGLRINQDLIEDMQCGSINLVVGSQGGKPQFQLMPWPYYPLLDGSPNSVITKNLDPVYSKFTNSIDTVKAVGYTENRFASVFTECKNRCHSCPDFFGNGKNSQRSQGFSAIEYSRRYYPGGEISITLCQQDIGCYERQSDAGISSAIFKIRRSGRACNRLC